MKENIKEIEYGEGVGHRVTRNRETEKKKEID